MSYRLFLVQTNFFLTKTLVLSLPTMQFVTFLLETLVFYARCSTAKTYNSSLTQADFFTFMVKKKNLTLKTD